MLAGKINKYYISYNMKVDVILADKINKYYTLQASILLPLRRNYSSLSCVPNFIQRALGSLHMAHRWPLIQTPLVDRHDVPSDHSLILWIFFYFVFKVARYLLFCMVLRLDAHLGRYIFRQNPM